MLSLPRAWAQPLVRELKSLQASWHGQEKNKSLITLSDTLSATQWTLVMTFKMEDTLEIISQWLST